LLLERIAPPIWKSQLAAGHLPAVKSLKWDAAYFFAEERELGREKAYLPTQQEERPAGSAAENTENPRSSRGS
jgi:hypothetical protein